MSAQHATIARLFSSAVAALVLASSGCDDAQVASCRGRHLEVDGDTYCVYSPVLARELGSAPCPDGLSNRLTFEGAVVCSSKPADVADLPPEVCAEIDVSPCGAGSSDGGDQRDAAAMDGGSEDAAEDAGSMDGALDANEHDLGAIDSGTESGSLESGAPDAAFDSATSDVGPPDDVGPSDDVEPPDAGTRDAGPTVVEVAAGTATRARF